MIWVNQWQGGGPELLYEPVSDSRKDAIAKRISAAEQDLVDLSHRIHAHPELGFHETRASAAELPARAVNHQPEFTAACATPTADKAVLDGATAMAWTAADLTNRGRDGGSGSYRRDVRGARDDGPR